MKKHLSSINFKNSIDTYKSIDESYIVYNLAKINLFIGANNSGKSRFLRGLFNNEDYEFLSNEKKSIDDLNSLIEEFKKSINKSLNQWGIYEILGLSYDFPKIIKKSIYEDICKCHQILKDLITFKSNEYTFFHNDISNDKIETFIQNKAKETLNKLDSFLSKPSFTKCYIPMLRGLRPIGEKSNKTSLFPYTDRTIKDYFPAHFTEINPGIDKKRFEERIITGLNFYDDCKIMLLGSSTQRKMIKDFETFLSSNFFNGKEINIIPRIREDGKDTHIIYLLIDKVERPIHEFGDGIQSIITLTYHMFFNKDKEMCYFIEEPDLCLHPGYQRIFLKLLASDEFEKHQFFITTHSNHFLDFTMDTDNISIYTFKKESTEDYVIENVSGGEMKTLELLGVRNSSVFLSNCTIWVEGITDRLYIRRFLELYNEKYIKNESILFLEDVHYSFLEYGGGNITHWSFLEDQDTDHPNIDVERLCSKLFLVTDNDGAGENEDGEKSAKKLRLEKLEESLGERYYCLTSREIENALPEETIKEVIKGYNIKNETADLDEIKQSVYKNEKLGQFIDANVAGLSKKFAGKYGVLTDKVNFCKKAIKSLNDYDVLTDDAKALTEKIVSFIKANNK